MFYDKKKGSFLELEVELKTDLYDLRERSCALLNQMMRIEALKPNSFSRQVGIDSHIAL